MKLFHCAIPEARAVIGNEGLRTTREDGYIFAWSSFRAADAYRFEMNASGWADIWEFDDRGRSEPSPGANDEAKVIGGDVPPDDLKLVYEAR
jgi:hypothetical protein